jgi:hypothetical protein
MTHKNRTNDEAVSESNNFSNTAVTILRGTLVENVKKINPPYSTVSNRFPQPLFL